MQHCIQYVTFSSEVCKLNCFIRKEIDLNYNKNVKRSVSEKLSGVRKNTRAKKNKILSYLSEKEPLIFNNKSKNSISSTKSNKCHFKNICG